MSESNTPDTPDSSMEMPRYQSIKKVWALQIEKIVKNPNMSIDLFFKKKEFATINLPQYKLVGKPKPKDGWYYVVYEGGYFSFSPAPAFEEGNVLITKLG
jgi:hypothetical protein